MNYLTWLLKAAIFFTLFAFALNNQQTVAVNFFFGTFWEAPLVLVVLTAFSVGLALGILLMMPRWWKNRRSKAHTSKLQPLAAAVEAKNNTSSVASESPIIPRHGL